MEDLSLVCLICEQDFIETPRVLPCGETICFNCITSSTKNSKLKCPLCKQTHSIPKGGFPCNKSLQKMIKALETKLENNPVYIQLSDYLTNIDNTIETIRFDLESGKQEINEYCSMMKNKVDLYVEEQIKLLHDNRDLVFTEIDNFQNECHKHLETNTESFDEFKNVIEESKELIHVEKKYFTKSKFDDKLLKDQIPRVKSLDFKVNSQKRKFKNFLLKNSNLVISRKKNSFKVVKNDTSVIDLNHYSKVNMNTLIDYKTIHDVKLTSNGNFLFLYTDEKNCFLKIVDFKNIGSSIKKNVKLKSKNQHIPCVATYNNKVAFSDYVSSGQSILKIFDQNLNQLEVDIYSFQFKAILECGNKIMTFVFDKNESSCRICFFDWDLNQLMMIAPNSSIYSFTKSVKAYYSSEDYLVFDEEDYLSLIQAEDGKLIRKISQQGKLMGIDSDSLLFYEDNQFKFYDFNENLIEAIDLVNFDPKFGLLIDNDRDFFFYDNLVGNFFLPKGFLSSI